MTWKEAADYTKNNRGEIKYSKTPIIDLDSREEKEKYRAHRHNKRNKKQSKNIQTGTMMKHSKTTQSR